MPDWAPKFLAALKLCPNVSAAADEAGVGRRTAYDWRDKCPEFRGAWDEAVDRSLDRLEQSTFKRAEETSDTLAIFLLKSHRPEQYGERLKIEHGGEIQVNWGDPQGNDAALASGAGLGADEPGAIQGAGVRPALGQDSPGGGTVL